MQKRILDLLVAHCKNLQEIFRSAEQRLLSAPEGSLNIQRKNSNIQYYIYKTEPSGKKKKMFLSSQQMSLVRALAQKSYDQSLYKAVQEEIRYIKKLLKKCSVNDLDQIYASLAPERKQLVVPYRLDDESYARQWEKVAYAPQPFAADAPFFMTLKGEKVRSKTEKIIADTLYLAGIPYRYEYPVTLAGGQTWHPDFLILNRRTRQVYILEHFGMMDNENYCNNALGKLRIYMQNGWFPGENLLVTFETRTRPFSTDDLDLLIRQYLL